MRKESPILAVAADGDSRTEAASMVAKEGNATRKTIITAETSVNNLLACFIFCSVRIENFEYKAKMNDYTR